MVIRLEERKQSLKLDNGNIVSAFLWKMLEKLGTKGIQVIIQIFLARLLLPDDYGMVAILTVFIGLSNVFIQGGFSTALIQKKEAANVDFSTALYTSCGIAALFYILLYWTAPLIADFYKMPLLEKLLRVLAVALFAGAVNSIQYAYISRQLQFRSYSLATISASCLSGLLGVILAYRGFGVWTLVFQQIAANYLAVIFLFLFVKWRPQIVFSINSLKEIFGYGWKILGTGLINSLYSGIYNLVIGKVYSSEMLGLYNRGDQFPNLIVNNVNDTVQSIVLPVLSNVQNEKTVVKRIMKKGLILNMFLVVPMMTGLISAGESVIRVLLTGKWLPAVPYMQLLCLIYMLYPIHTMNIQCMKALGRSDIFLKLEIIKKGIEGSVLLLTVGFGIKAMIIGQIATSLFSIILNIYPISKLIQYGLKEQMMDIAPTLVTSIIMGIWIAGIEGVMQPGVVKLCIQIGTGGLLFICLNLACKNPAITLCLNILKGKKNAK